MRGSRAFAVMVGFAILAVSAFGTPEERVQAPVKRVTVYPDQAHVTRVCSLDLPSGEHSILIENLPSGVADASFQFSASGVAGITLLGLTHTTQEHLEAPIQKVAQLERELDSLVKNGKQVVSDRLESLDQLKGFLAALGSGAADDAANQVAKGGFNVAQWSEAYDFMSKKSFALSDSVRWARQELEDIDSRLQLVRNELRKLGTVNQRTTKTVNIGLNLEQAGRVELSLEYLVPGAQWTPRYDARIDANPDQVDFTYQAEVSQRTGEDWTDVELTLSTAQVSLGAGPEELAPWFLAEMRSPSAPFSGGPAGQITGRMVHQETGEPVIGASVVVVGTTQGAMTDLNGRFRILRMDPGIYTLRVSHLDCSTMEITGVAVKIGETSQINQRMMAKVTDPDKTIRVVGTHDILDKFVVDGRPSMSQESIRQRPVQDVDNLLAQVAGVQTNASREAYVRGGRASEVAYVVEAATILASGACPAVFKVKGTESIASGGDAVRVTVANWKLDGETRLIARPRNREGAFRLVTLKNHSEAPILAGQVAIFVGAHFLGNTYLEQVIAPGEEFDLPFGLDSYVTVKREIVDFMKSAKGDRVETEQTIQITINNLSSTARTLELEEPLPISRDNRIKVKLGKITPEPSQGDQAGTPRWSLTLEPGTDVKILIPYEVRYPARMRVAGL